MEFFKWRSENAGFASFPVFKHLCVWKLAGHPCPVWAPWIFRGIPRYGRV